MILRPTSKNDLNDVIKIIDQAKVYFKDQKIDQWQDGYPNEATILNDICNKEAFVLEDQDEIIATVMISCRPEVTYNYIEGQWLQDGPYLVIHRIAIRNDQKGKNLAKLILDNAIALFPCTSIRMDTHEDNLSMQRFLSKYGFNHCGTIYLENQDKRLAYEKVL